LGLPVVVVVRHFGGNKTNHGVRFIAVTQNLDTDIKNPASRFLLHVLGAVADYAEPAIMQSHSAENDAVAGFVMIRDSTLSRLKE
jgi:hypothetical protein